jgi:dihydrofolate synthase/folylpolyglutamate synthase
VSYLPNAETYPLLGPSLPGDHQRLNLCLAISMLLRQRRIMVSEQSIHAGAKAVRWPARMQRLGAGPLTALAPDQPVWLDGGHNPSAGAAIAAHFDGPLHLVIGMIAGKDPQSLLKPLGDKIRTLTVVPVPHHDCHPAEAFAPDAKAAANLEEALLGLPSDDFPILIAGSLYLAGEVLRLNDEVPE